MGFFDDSEPTDRVQVPGGTGGVPVSSFFDDPNAPPADGGITPGGGFNEKGTPDAPSSGGLLNPYPYQFNPNAPGGGSLGGGGGNYQNTPEGRAAFLSQFQSNPSFNAELFDSYLQSHPDWTQNVPYWTGRLGDPDGTGSNAPGAGGGAYAGLPTFTAQTYTAPTYTPTPVTAAQPFSYAALDAPAPFTAPTYDQATQDPGYKFRLAQGQQTLENSAAARGTLLTGGTAKALQDYGQQAASQEYQNVYNRALSDYTTNTGTQLGAQNQAFNQAYTGWSGNASNSLAAQTAGGQLALGTYQLNSQNAQNAWQNNYQSAWNAYLSQVQQAQFGANYGLQAGTQAFNQAAQTYGINQGNYYTGQQNQYNGYMGIAGLGANAASGLNAGGANYAGNAGNIYGQQGNAAAGGIVGSANAANSGLAGVSNAASFAGYLAWLNSQNGKGNAGGLSA